MFYEPKHTHTKENIIYIWHFDVNSKRFDKSSCFTNQIHTHTEGQTDMQTNKWSHTLLWHIQPNYHYSKRKERNIPDPKVKLKWILMHVKSITDTHKQTHRHTHLPIDCI